MTDIEKARRLIGQVQLEGIRLVSASCRSRIRSSEEASDKNVVTRLSSKVPRDAPKDGFFVRVGLKTRIGTEEDDRKPSVSIDVEYELEYGVPEGMRVSRAEMVAFARVNGRFNAWPYFRRHVQTTMQRMELPPIILPVYRVSEHMQVKPKKGAVEKEKIEKTN